MTEQEIFNKIKGEFDGAITHMKSEFARLQVGRATSLLVEGIPVDVYGASQTIKMVANISIPDPRTIQIQPWDKNMLTPIEKAIVGNRVGDIGYAVQKYVEEAGYSVVRDLVGHGLGKHLHEKPEIPNYGRRGIGTKLKEGLVICIEPMINLGKNSVIQEKDGWTIRTVDNLPSAHYEHAVAIRKNQTDILSSFKEIEEVLSKEKS